MMPVKCCCTKAVVPTVVFFILALGLPLPAVAQESVSGSPGIATQRAVIDFSDLAWHGNRSHTAAAKGDPSSAARAVAGAARVRITSASRHGV